MSRRSQATQLVSYKNYIKHVKEVSFKGSHVTISASVIAKQFKVRHETLAAMVDLGMVEKIMDLKTPKYRWKFGDQDIHPDIKDTDPKIIQKVYDKTQAKLKEYKSYGYNKPKADNAAKEEAPLTQLQQERSKLAMDVVRKDYLSRVKDNAQRATTSNTVKKGKTASLDTKEEKQLRNLTNSSSLFNINHLAILKQWPISKKTDLHIEVEGSSDICMMEGVDSIFFNVDGSKVTLEIVTNNSEGAISAMFKMQYTAVVLKFSNRGISDPKVDSLFITVKRL